MMFKLQLKGKMSPSGLAFLFFFRWFYDTVKIACKFEVL